MAFLNRCIWRASSSGAGSFVVASKSLKVGDRVYWAEDRTDQGVVTKTISMIGQRRPTPTLLQLAPGDVMLESINAVETSAISGHRIPQECANPAVVNSATYRY